MSTLGYVRCTLVYILSTLGYFGFVGCTLGYDWSSFVCIAFASIVVNIQSLFGYVESTLGAIESTLGVYWEYFRVY